MKMLPLLIGLLFCIQVVSAATLSGIIYDLSFEEVDNTIVEINTQPKQVTVAKQGRYSFEIPEGTYILKAKKESLIASENITVTVDGNYTLDLILFPSFEEEDELSNDLEENTLLNELDKKPTKDYVWYFLALAVVAVINFWFAYKKRIQQFLKKRKERLHTKHDNTDSDLQQVLQIIHNERGRTTQKEIRKQVPLSEAKISLILTELEQEGKIKKYKKGRSNIVILKEK